MTKSLLVRNVEEELVSRLKRRAALNGRSAEAEHREILQRALSADTIPDFAELAAQIRKLTQGQEQIPAEILLREGRNAR